MGTVQLLSTNSPTTEAPSLLSLELLLAEFSEPSQREASEVTSLMPTTLTRTPTFSLLKTELRCLLETVVMLSMTTRAMDLPSEITMISTSVVIGQWLLQTGGTLVKAMSYLPISP